jgi:Helix-turn-helix domain
MRREKTFGDGPTTRLDKNARARVVAFARARLHRSGPGRPTCTTAVLRTLLSFLGNRTGRCFPALATIAARAHCHRDTVVEALKVLEAAKVLTWQHRLIKVRERVVDLFGVTYSRWRVLRTSNAYCFKDPKAVSNIPTRKGEEDSSPYSLYSATDSRSPLERALASLGAAIEARNRIEVRAA